MPLSSVEFIDVFTEIVGQIEKVVSPTYFPAIRKLYVTDPHDLIEPGQCFASSNEAYGFVFKQMIRIQNGENNAA
jgi:hypothetical protein